MAWFRAGGGGPKDLSGATIAIEANSTFGSAGRHVVKKDSLVTANSRSSVTNHDNSYSDDFSTTIKINGKIVASDTSHVTGWGGGSMGANWSGFCPAGTEILVEANTSNDVAINWTSNGNITVINVEF